ncbi:MAG: hypothetical protein GY719_05985 [bacterium]|nr:hypothetical protein [bacterium]
MTTFELTSLKKSQGTWHLTLEDDSASLTPSEGGTPLVIPRSETLGRLELVRIWGGQGALMVPREGKLKKLELKLEPGQTEAVDEWLGPPTTDHLRLFLRKRYAFGVPIGLFLVLASLPMAGDPAAGLEAVPASPITAVLGVGLVVMWALARYRPTPRLLLADTVWFSLLLVSTVVDILTGRSSVWWLVLCVVLVVIIHRGIREYGRFKYLTHTGQTDEP